MNYILFDPINIEDSYPFTLTRPFAELRTFGGTIKEHWENLLGCKVSYFTRPYLSNLYPTNWVEGKNILINSSSPLNLKLAEKFEFNLSSKDININLTKKQNEIAETINSSSSYFINDSLLSFLFNFSDYMKKNKTNVHFKKNIIFNDSDGPIIIEEDVEIMEGAMIRGPVFICKNSVVKMGAKIYGPTIIGPNCKVSGEISNSIFLGYSNKAHDGFLGHSIIGEWCNIGAGSCNSNLKNNYDSVKIWSYKQKKFYDTGEQFLGLYFGDHSKCAINTSFNSGTIVGVNCNIFGSGFPRNYIPSFSWGGRSGLMEYSIDKAISTAKIVMKRRSIEISDEYIKMMKNVFNMTSNFR